MTERNITKVKLCSSTGIARTTLDAILNGSDARISTVEAIAAAVGVPISYLFDEESPAQGGSVRTEGDFSPASLNGNVTNNVGAAAVLKDKIKSLEALLAEKERTIRILLSQLEKSTPIT